MSCKMTYNVGQAGNETYGEWVHIIQYGLVGTVVNGRMHALSSKGKCPVGMWTHYCQTF